MVGKAHHDDFDTFLMNMQKESAPQKSEATTMRIMETLSQVGKTDVVQLMVMMKVSWSEFTEGMNSLRAAGLIDMEEDDQISVVRLTQEGSRWAVTMSASGGGGNI
jgi:Mn-dependent DtxR family transcriptional regulator